ncbi:MAG TPA: HEAT repeat domain-containing protein, partial [Polyangia bacterium]
MTDPRARLTLSKDDAARLSVVEQLAHAGAQSVGALVAALDDPSWAVRRAVVAALARIGAPAVERLAGVLKSGRDHEARLAAAVDALSASRGPVEATMLALIDEAAPPPVMCDAAQVLGRRKSAASVPTLERLTTHADDNVAVAAIEALGRIGGGAGVSTLVALVARGNFFRTFPALEVLGGSGDRRAVEPLLRALGNPLFAIEAVRALGHTGDERAVPALLDRLRDAQESLVRTAAVALAETHRRVHERLGTAGSVEATIAGYARASFAAERAARCLPNADPAEQVAIC